MPLYLVKPKAGVRSAAISLAGRKMTLAARQKQSAEVIDLNRNDPAQQAIREWSAKSLKFGGLRAPLTGDVLGVHLVQMNGEDASRRKSATSR